MRILTLLFAILFLSVTSHGQVSQKVNKNCFEEWHAAFIERGSLPVKDGEHDVVISIRSDTGCYCGEGKITVKEGKLIPSVLVKKEDGSYEPARRELHPKMQQGHVVSQNQYTIYKGMSQTFLTLDDAIADIFFVDCLKGKSVKNAKAPSPNDFEGRKVELVGKQKEIVEKAYEGLVFDNGKSTIKSTSFPHLNLLASMLVENKDYKLTCNGYTDNVGKAESNLVLSQKRAEAVKKYLVKQGVEEARINSEGFGLENPIADNTTSEGRAKNRRVEFIVTK